MPLALLLFSLNYTRNYAIFLNVLILHKAQKIMLAIFFKFYTNANAWHQNYNASTFLIIRNLFEMQKNHLLSVFQYIYIWMVGGNLGITGSGVPAGSEIAQYLDPFHAPLFWFYNQYGVVQW